MIRAAGWGVQAYFLQSAPRPRPETPHERSHPQQRRQKAQLRQAALDYHEHPVPGKIAVAPTKPLVNQRDLSLAYARRGRALRGDRARPGSAFATPRAATWWA
jgi:hypothetical protein